MGQCISDPISLATKENTKRWTIEGKKRAKVIDVYDGDTVTCAIDIGGQIWAVKVRLNGVDAPEMKSRDGKERLAAVLSRQAIVNALPADKLVTLTCHGFEKYGRLLASINAGGADLSTLLIRNGHAVPYDGGHKAPFHGVS